MNKLVLIHFILSSYAAQLQQYWNEIKKNNYHFIKGF